MEAVIPVMSAYDQIKSRLATSPSTWLITGVAGFIGSNLLETLLKLDQIVVGLDNFATGLPGNLEEVQGLVTPQRWKNFRFLEGDIRRLDDCRQACEGIEYVLHQAALGSVPRSIEDPLTTNETNITGFLNMLVAARDSGVRRFVYAASSVVLAKCLNREAGCLSYSYPFHGASDESRHADQSER